MKKQIAALFLSLLISFPAYAVEIAEEGSRGRVFQRALVNAIFSPIEISSELGKVKREDDWWVPSWIPALGIGTVKTVARVFSSVYDVAAVPFTKDVKPLMQPEFVWELLEENR